LKNKSNERQRILDGKGKSYYFYVLACKGAFDENPIKFHGDQWAGKGWTWLSQVNLTCKN
jgi:YHS domain-containing protein